MKNIIFKHIPAGNFIMGATNNIGHPIDKELPQVDVSVDEFQISETTITNEQFQDFVSQTGYITTAEKLGGSFVFYLLADKDVRESSVKLNETPWWLYVKGASWKSPFGPNTNIDNLMDHPVVHISFVDALEYCKHYGYRLPTEAEWEYAARGGHAMEWPWGEDFMKDNKHQCNIWQGNFPYTNTEDDGFLGTAPAKYYESNPYGLYNLIGNIWEWCDNYRAIDLADFANNDIDLVSSLDLNEINDNTQVATRGGSFLCHSSYCNRYRLGARNGSSATSTTSNCGFRVCK